MLKVIEIAFTGYPVTNMARARNFYEDVLGLKPTTTFGDEKASWIEYDIGPGTLAITNMAAEWKPSSQGAAVALEVEDFDKAVSWLKEKKVKFVYEPMTSPICRMAVIADPDGNNVTIHKRDPVR